MPQPIVICLEDLDADELDRTYLQCSVLVGDAPGLRLDARGEARWNVDEPLLELCVSADDQLLVYLPPEAALRAVLSRDGRSLEIPAAKPVVALDGDVLAVGGRRYQIHVHGAAPWEAAPPRWLSPAELGVESEPPSAGHGAVKVAATALALGAALSMGAAGCTKKAEQTKPIDVRDRPPKVAPVREDAKPPVKPDAKPTLPDAAKAVIKTKKPPVEVRVRPPRVAPQPRPSKPKPRMRPATKGLESDPQLDRKGDD